MKCVRTAPIHKQGFILFTIMAMLVAMAILALGFNSLKRGSVEQLAKTADQNRLAVIAQAANNETIALIKSQVNDSNQATEFFKEFRKVFKTGTLPCIKKFDIFTPPETRKFSEPYAILVRTQATLAVTARVNTARAPAYSGYVEVISQATHKSTKTSVEIKERRELRLVDMRDFFDKYVVYVKNFCPDLNNPQRRIVLTGLKDPKYDQQIFSHAFFGTNFYPPSGANTPLSMAVDLNMDEDAVLMKDLFGFSGSGGAVQKKGFDITNPNWKTKSGQKLCYAKKVNFSDFAGEFSATEFYSVPELKKVYLKVMFVAANGILGTPSAPPEDISPQVVQQLCQQAKAKIDGGTSCDSTAKTVVLEYLAKVPNPPAKYKDGDFSGCTYFQKVVNDCFPTWAYHFGLTDAPSVWDLSSQKLKDYAQANLTDFGIAKPFSGLWTYCKEQLSDPAGVAVNVERARLGKGADLYSAKNGATDITPVFVEGLVNFRIFKIGFLDETKFPAQLGGSSQDVPVDVVPLDFIRPEVDQNFSNKTLGNDYFDYGGTVAKSENVADSLMSTAIEIPVNRILANKGTIRLVQPDGNETVGPLEKLKEYDPVTNPETQNKWVFPSQKGGGGAGLSGNEFYPSVQDFKAFSAFYDNGDEFLAEKLVGDTLFLDGKICILNKDLDLRQVRKIHGNGLLFVPRGNCKLGAKLEKTKPSDLCRIYLQAGSFSLDGAGADAEIQASLIALVWDDPNDPSTINKADRGKQGKLLLNGKSTVKIFGNLIVDYLYTEGDTMDSAASMLADGGTLTIEHDPAMYAAPGEGVDPYRISLGQVRAMYAMNAGGPTL